MTGEEDNPLWTMMVRVQGEPMVWEAVMVPARSVLQAEAVLRRQGYEVWEFSPGLAEAKGLKSIPGWNGLPATLPLLCERCEYPLDSMTIDLNAVVCSECGCRQRVFNRMKSLNPRSSNRTSWGSLKSLCTTVGALVIGFAVLYFVLAIVRVLL